MRGSAPISHSITGPLAKSIGPGLTGAERGKALTNAGGLSGPPFGVHYMVLKNLLDLQGDSGENVEDFRVAAVTKIGVQEAALSTWIFSLLNEAVSREVFVFSVVNRLLVRWLLRPALISVQLRHVHLPSDLCQ